MDHQIFDVTKLIDEQKIGAFTIRVVIISFVIMLFPGRILWRSCIGRRVAHPAGGARSDV